MNNPTQNYLSVLFSPYFENHEGFLEFRLMKSNGQTHQYFFPSLEQIPVEFKASLETLNADGWNIYIGVLPRNQEKGGADAIAHATTLWVDLDAKHFEDSKDKALASVLAFPITPTMIVDSGHGYHAYWLLEEPIDLQDQDRKKLFLSTLRGLIKAVNGDPAVKDLPRLLRVPGYNNCKDPNALVPCVLLEDYFHPGTSYALSAFAEYVQDDGTSLGKKVKDEIALSSIAVPERFRRLLAADKRLLATWKGTQTMPHDQTRSGMDMSLADQLVHHKFTPSEIAAILREFPHGKGQDASETYMLHTITKAFSSSQERISTEDTQLAKARALLQSINSEQTSRVDIPIHLDPLADILFGVDTFRVQTFFEDEVKRHFKMNKDQAHRLLRRMQDAQQAAQEQSVQNEKNEKLIRDREVNSGEVMAAVAKTTLLPPELLEIAMAVHISSAFRFNPPIWLLVIGVPASSKTAMINLMRIAENSYMLDTMTENAFMSGFVPKNGGETFDLLPRLDGKCFMVKDLSAMFSMNEDTVKKLLGDLTSIFDGDYAKFTATRGELQCDALFSMIGCVTPATLEKHYVYARQLGPRFFYMGIPDLTEEERAQGFVIARQTKKQRDKDLDHAQRLASSFCTQKIERILQEKPEFTFADSSIETWFEEASLLLARGRGLATVERETFTNEKNEEVEYYDTKNVQIEQPWRIYNQLKALACALAFLRCRTVVQREELDSLRNILVSTMPVDRSAVLKQLIRQAGLSAKEIGNAIDRSGNAVRSTLKEMEAVGLVDSYLHHEPGDTKAPKRYFILEQFVDILQAARIPPEFRAQSPESVKGE